MTKKPITNSVGLPADQLDLIEQFEADYNAVDQFLRRNLNRNAQYSFAALVGEYSRKHPGWRDAALLRTIAEVRNAIVHGKTEPYRYVAVPTPAILHDLKSCRDRLIRPDLVIPKFQREVTSVSPNDSLAFVLTMIAERDYSQFPVCDGKKFRGLLTENGITRWLALHVSNELSLIELEDVHIENVLCSEEHRRNWQFVARDKRVDDVSAMFAANALLEAVIITANGKESEALLGIVTRWDIVGTT